MFTKNILIDFNYKSLQNIFHFKVKKLIKNSNFIYFQISYKNDMVKYLPILFQSLIHYYKTSK